MIKNRSCFFIVGFILFIGFQSVYAESMFGRFFPEEGYEVAYLIEPAFGQPEGFSISKNSKGYTLTVKTVSNWKKVNDEADRLSKETVISIKSTQSLSADEQQRIRENNRQAFKNVSKMIVSKIKIEEKVVFIGEETARKMMELLKAEAESSEQNTNRLDGNVITIAYPKDGEYCKISF